MKIPGIWSTGIYVKIPSMGFRRDTRGVDLPHNSYAAKVDPSHLPRLLVRGLSGNTCRDYSLTSCDASSWATP